MVAIYDGGNYIDAVRNTYMVELGSPPSIEDFKQASMGIVVIPNDSGDDRVQALVRLEEYSDRYLLAIRYVDLKVLQN